MAWERPLFAPRATDTVPRWRASAKLRRRTLAARLHALAERAIHVLEAAPRVDLTRLREALEVLKLTMRPWPGAEPPLMSRFWPASA